MLLTLDPYGSRSTWNQDGVASLAEGPFDGWVPEAEYKAKQSVRVKQTNIFTVVFCPMIFIDLT